MKKILVLVLGVLAGISSAASAFTLTGDQVEASMIRTVDSGYGLGRIYGYGLEAPFTVADGAADKQEYSGAFTLDVNGDRFTIRYLQGAGWQDGITFRLDDLDFAGPGGNVLSSLTVDTNLVGYTLVHGDDFLEIDWGGTHFDTSTYFIGRFNVSAVPEPTTLSILALGLAGLLGRRHLLRREKKD